METRGTRIGLGIATALVIAFLWLPLLLILAYAFNSSTIQSWPISGFTFQQLAPERQREIERRLRERLPAPITLETRAWAARGTSG